MKTLKIVTGALLMMCSIAHAGETFYSKSYDKCMDASEGVTSKMIDCIQDEYTKQDKRLNAAYKQLGSQVSPEQKKQLLTAQRLWIKYRDANCSFYYDPDGGSLARINSVGCDLEMTVQRANELEKLVQSY